MKVKLEVVVHWDPPSRGNGLLQVLFLQREKCKKDETSDISEPSETSGIPK